MWRNCLLLCLLFSSFPLWSQNPIDSTLTPLFFLRTRPGLPPDSLVQPEYKGKRNTYFTLFISKADEKGYAGYRYKEIRYLAYKNRIHSADVRFEYTEDYKTFVDVLRYHYGEAEQPDPYRPYYYWYKPDVFISFEEDIISGTIQVRVVSRSVQAQFEKDHPELME